MTTETIIPEFGSIEYYEYCLGQVIQALIDEGKEEIAVLFMPCQISAYVCNSWNGVDQLSVELTAPIAVIRALQVEDEDHYNTAGGVKRRNGKLRQFEEILDVVIGPYNEVNDIDFKISPQPLPPNWRVELMERATKKGAANQGTASIFPNRRHVDYAGLQFGSNSEVRIARELDRQNVMYLPGCAARVNVGQDKETRWPDFLICEGGKWGILEVDGEPFHPPTRTVHDHERDRLFLQYGIRVVQHYDANRCYQEPREVVHEFLALLRKNG